ncbi:helix-turn-helix domain-containing protein [Ectobacillus funiculus]|uniref:Helix-turn-helix domain-containing protein n=1 Tax=Ectobacillus funiculus TaxID=137993 RepID=A0ABV5WMI4_9BACI
MNIGTAIYTLQKGAAYLPGDEASFRVYYWGAHPNHQDNPIHKHSFVEICYVMDGSGLYLEDGTDYTLKEGTFFCSRPGKLHRIHKGQNLSLLWVGFEIDEGASTEEAIHLFRRLAETSDFHIEDATQSPAALLWKTLLGHASHPCPDVLLRSLGYSLLLSLQVLFCPMSIVDERKHLHSHSSANKLIQQAQLFIQDNLAQPLSLTDVAQYLHISPRHLSRLFSENLGVPFTSFVRKERVRASAEMLRSTNLAIKTISEATGFSSVYYFTAVFSEETSVAPGEYRKLNQLQKE